MVRGLRGWIRILVIVLSARDARGLKVAALDAGDLVTRPFGMDELPARVRASPAGDDPPMSATAAFTAAGGVRLTPTEWRLLEILVRRRGRLLPRVWGPAYCRFAQG